ncbi:MAG: FCD domain-containing protein [Gammaproteobacteria bacterium]|nr:GntR family transcriptional regulator [Gemmatimonadota bacterium]NIU78154.1 FCD domain-containing protein [Gammaproteobacteria bacterium]NIQ57973.1 GntR family transcriptional regulator [Gemmatimonadota bacterium]NIT89451.1 GntR family transcriptional regulator [Gemmatimonadota bacterium]NIW66308.1 FCD domain-containing protein [Gemmatimonadota bacterium]
MAKMTSAADETYVTLRDLIAEGRLAPGSRLVESDLARRLGVSRTPIRTALVRLQQEGYVEPLGNGRRSRLAVTPLTRDDSRELYLIVAELEGLAARWAAELDEEERSGLVEEQRRINGELLEAARNDPLDAGRLFELDAAFHRTFVEAGEWPRLQRLHRSLKPHTERYWRLYTGALVNWIDTSLQEHEEIVGAIEAGDPEAAASAAKANWANGVERLARLIDNWGERGIW